MRVAIVYRHFMAGGCEKRAAELACALSKVGDEVWLVGAGVSEQGWMMMDRIGVPRTSFVPWDGITNWEQWLIGTMNRIAPDIADVQWEMPLPPSLGVPTVATIHGSVPLPEPGVFDWRGVIQVQHIEGTGGGCELTPLYWEIANWVDLDRFPLREEPGENVAFFGRAYKAAHLREIWDEINCDVDLYSMDDDPGWQWPAHVHWRGFADPAETMSRYRVVFASAQAALEALACGRSVIAGHPGTGYAWVGWVPWGDLVTPENFMEMSRGQFALRGPPGSGPDLTRDHLIEQLDRAFEQSENVPLRYDIGELVARNHGMEGQTAKIRAAYEQALGGGA